MPDADMLKNVLVNGIVKDISDAWARRSTRATVILVYCGIDAMAYLTMPAGKAKTDRSDFVRWTDQYMRFRDANGQPNLKLPGLELYAARCAMVHTYGTEADLHKNGAVQRQIGYTDEMLPEIREKQAVQGLVLVSIRGLVDSFQSGVIATLADVGPDAAMRALFGQRLEKMVHDMPIN